jgi:hypothetical protein
MKITQNFQLTVFISMLGIPFLGQAAQVAPTPVSSAHSLPQRLSIPIRSFQDVNNIMMQIGNELAKTSRQIQLAETQQVTAQTSIIKQQLLTKQKVLQNQLAATQAQMKNLAPLKIQTPQSAITQPGAGGKRILPSDER